MTPLTGDEIAVLIKARDLLYDKRNSDTDTDTNFRVVHAYGALLNVLQNSYVDVP